jgi:hypothetical protein
MSTEGKRRWFDDPEWTHLKQRTDSAKIQHPTSTKSPTNTETKPKKIEVSFNLSLPHVNLGFLRPYIEKVRKYSRQINLKRAAIALTSISLIVAGFGVYGFIRQSSHSAQPGEAAKGDQAQSPAYQPILPDGDETATDSPLAYDPQRGIVSYTDKIKNIPITVSQQPLPANFAANPDKEVENIAKNFSAKEVIEAGGTKAFLGTSFKGPQSVILHKNKLLIFLYSDNKIEKEDWAVYIMGLQ